MVGQSCNWSVGHAVSLDMTCGAVTYVPLHQQPSNFIEEPFFVFLGKYVKGHGHCGLNTKWSPLKNLISISLTACNLHRTIAFVKQKTFIVFQVNRSKVKVTLA